MITKQAAPHTRFSKLEDAIGAWSDNNFGNQQSKCETVHVEDHASRQRGPYEEYILLNSTAPLLGIYEEIGELADAIQKQDLGLAKDAVGDTMIYLCDFLFRSGLPLTIRWDEIDTKLDLECPVCEIGRSTTFMLTRMGMLAHAVLKHHQGIRGYEQGEIYIPEMNHCIEDLILCLGRMYSLAKRVYFSANNPQTSISSILEYAAVDTSEILTLTEQAWLLVQQRNWKKSPKTGHG